MHGDWIPIVMFVAIAAVAIGYLIYRSRDKHERQVTMQAAIQRGDALTPELIAAINNDRSAPAADYRRGVLLIALSLALVIFGYFVDHGGTELFGIAAIPAMLGLGYLFVWKFGPRD